MQTLLLMAFGLWVAGTLPSYGQDAEQFRIEFTGASWRVNASGDILTTADALDLERDLGVHDGQRQAYLKLAIQPVRRHRILVEWIPYRITGESVVERTFEFGGQTFPLQEPIASRADMKYFFGGYQYDLISLPQGHAGVLAGVGYFDATATSTSPRFGSGTEERRTPLPAIGAAFRIFPIPRSRVLNLNGEIKGAWLASHGRHTQTLLNAGFGVIRHITLQVGYNHAAADAHNRARTTGVDLRFSGPIFSVQFRDR